MKLWRWGRNKENSWEWGEKGIMYLTVSLPTADTNTKQNIYQ